MRFSFTILVNGKLKGQFHASKRLRQVDLIPPILLLLRQGVKEGAKLDVAVVLHPLERAAWDHDHILWRCDFTYAV